jgi:glycolate oxidase FAD binding subunit
MKTAFPTESREVVEVVADTIGNGRSLEVVGAGSKRGLGRPVIAAGRICTASLRGVVLYEPSELVLTAAAGTPVRDIVDLLDEHHQELAFEPMSYRSLYGGNSAGTLGGMIAVNASGPRRIKVGAARDHVLGFRAVSGRSEEFKSGGRVMKNVTGYDMSKLMTGSFGTLAVLTEVTVKVLPKAETEETLLMLGLDDGEAINCLTEASGLPHEVSGLSHLPPKSAPPVGGLPSNQSVTALRLEGPAISIAQRKQNLIAHFKRRHCEFHSLAEGESKKLWASIRDVVPLASLDSHIWRISTSPTEGSRVVETIRKAEAPVTGWYYDWAGGLIWLATESTSAAWVSAIRTTVDGFGGHATLVRAPEEIRSRTPVFHPQQTALAMLSARVKHNFDPARVLNRGRMREDI